MKVFKKVANIVFLFVLQLFLIGLFQLIGKQASLCVGAVVIVISWMNRKFISTSLMIGFPGLIAIWIVIPCIFGFLISYRHGGFDIAWYAQAIWNVAQFKVPMVTVAIPLHHLSNHFEPIIYVLGYMYQIFFSWLVSYQFLFLMQFLVNVLVILSFYPLVKQVRHYPKALAATIALGGVVMHWGYFAANRFEFHPPTFGLALFLSSFAWYLRNHILAAVFLSLLSAMCGEMFIIIGFTTAALYLASKLKGARSFLGMVLVGFGFGVILLFSYFKIIQRAFAVGGNYSDFVGERYSQVGNSITDIIMFPFLKPIEFFEIIFTPDKQEYLLKLFLPVFVILSVYLIIQVNSLHRRLPSWRYLLVGTLIIAAPLAKVLLGNYPSYLRNDVHYAADILPGIFLVLFSFGFVWKDELVGFLRGVTLIFGALMLAFGPLTLLHARKAPEFNQSLLSKDFRRFLRSLDSNLSVYTDNSAFSAELSDRAYIFTQWADTSVDPLAMPDIVVLAWPPEHFNQGQLDGNSFRRSFLVRESGKMVSYYRGGEVAYFKISVFQKENWGEISIWAKVAHFD